MLFSPKRRERYCAALRQYLQKKIIRHGADQPTLLRLKSVTLYGILENEQPKTPINAIDYADTLLGAAVIILLRRNCFLTTSLHGNSVQMLRSDLFSATLLELISCCAKGSDCEITVSELGNGIKITGTGSRPGPVLQILAKKTGATLVRIESEQLNALFIPAEKTETRPVIYPDEWHYLLDPLSTVNVFLTPPQMQQ